MNKAAVNIHVQFLCDKFSTPFKYQGMQFTRLYGKSVFSFVRNHQTEFQSCFMFCVVISNEWDFCCPTSSQSLDTVSVMDLSHSNSVVGWFLKAIFLSKYNSHTIKFNWVVSLYSLSCATSLLSKNFRTFHYLKKKLVKIENIFVSKDIMQKVKG